MRGTRRSLFVALLVAIVLTTTAQPAAAADPTFKGRYYATWTTIHGQSAFLTRFHSYAQMEPSFIA